MYSISLDDWCRSVKQHKMEILKRRHFWQVQWLCKLLGWKFKSLWGFCVKCAAVKFKSPKMITRYTKSFAEAHLFCRDSDAAQMLFFTTRKHLPTHQQMITVHISVFFSNGLFFKWLTLFGSVNQSQSIHLTSYPNRLNLTTCIQTQTVQFLWHQTCVLSTWPPPFLFCAW